MKEKTWKGRKWKRFLSLVITLAMVLTLLPLSSITAYAAYKAADGTYVYTQVENWGGGIYCPSRTHSLYYGQLNLPAIDGVGLYDCGCFNPARFAVCKQASHLWTDHAGDQSGNSKCEYCGEKITEGGSCTVLTTYGQEPTCEKSGYKDYYTCYGSPYCYNKFEECEFDDDAWSDIGVNKIENLSSWRETEGKLEALGHEKGTHHDAKDPTCSAKGNVEYWDCARSGCGAKIDDSLQKISNTEIAIVPENHTFSTTWSYTESKHWHAATCLHDVISNEDDHTFDASTGKCSVCDYECLHTGQTGATCTVCGKSLHVHEGISQPEQAATCTTDGWKVYYKCSCGNFFEDAACTTLIGDETDLATWKTTENKGKIDKFNHDWNFTSDGAALTASCSRKTTCGQEDVLLVLTATSPTYSGNPVDPVSMDKTAWEAAGFAVPTIQYFDSTGSEVESSQLINAGIYTAKISFGDVTAEKQFEITKATPTYTAPTAKILTETGSAQELVNAGSASNGTMQYKLGADGTYSTDIPKATKAGTYTVYYKVVGDSNYSDVAEASVEVTVQNFFEDVHSQDYYYDAVLWAARNGITLGTDDLHFSPLNVSTRAQMVTFLWRSAGSPTVSAEMPFNDVEKDSYYYDAVLWGISSGVVKGTSATTFTPDATVTRAQAVTFLARLSGVTDEAQGYTHNFTDVEAGAYYNNAVAWASENGITEGVTATTFAPDDGCLRGQVVTFLYRYFAK